MSQSQPNNQFIVQNCSICCIDYQRPLSQEIRPSQICYKCWFNHVKTSLTKISYKIGTDMMSPFQGGEDMNVCLVLNSLNESDRKNLQQWLFKKYTTFTTDIQKCPQQTCDFVFMTEKCRWGASKNYNCPKCDCPLIATKQSGIKSIFGYIYFLLFIKKCPKCDIPIDKISGCPHMTCPCGHQFCWYCLKDYNSTNIHQPRKCAVIVITKIVIMLSLLVALIPIIFGLDVFGTFLSWLGAAMALVLRLIIMDVIIAVQIFFGFVITGPKYDYRRKGFLNSMDSKHYFLAIFLLDVGIIGFLYWMQQLWLFFGILLGELATAGILTGSFVAIVFSAETWFEYIA